MTRESAVEVVKYLTELTKEHGFCHVQVGDAEIMAGKGVYDETVFYRIRGTGFSAEQLCLSLMLTADIPDKDRFSFLTKGDLSNLRVRNYE